MIFESVIKWRKFDAARLAKRRFEVVLLLRSYIESVSPSIYTDVWTGDCLLHHQEHRVDRFCPLDEINLPPVEVYNEP